MFFNVSHWSMISKQWAMIPAYLLTLFIEKDSSLTLSFCVSNIMFVDNNKTRSGFRPTSGQCPQLPANLIG